MSPKDSTPPTSRHFSLEQLAEGVYAALALPGGAAFSNAGIVDLGEQTLIFDTFETPQAAEDLRAAAEHLTGRPATCVIISHVHADHWCGNQAFDPQVPILTHRAIREEMPAAIAWMQELSEHPEEVKQEIQASLQQLETESDPRQRASLQAYITRMEYWQAMLPTLELRYPTQTFDGEFTFYGTRRTAELRAAAPGHTVCDAYLVLPGDSISFVGDLGFFQSQPFMAYCDPQAWQAWLAGAEQWDVETFVPGHGPVGTKADLTLERQYIAALEELVSRAIQDGLPVEEALELSLPAPFDAWVEASQARWEANVHTLYERLADGPGA
jgi:cyclase